MSFFIGLCSSSTSKASLGLEGAGGDLSEDSIGVTGLGCPAGNDVDGNAFALSSVFSPCKGNFRFFLLGVSSPLGFMSPPSLLIASPRISCGAGTVVPLLSLSHFLPKSFCHNCFCIFIFEFQHHMLSTNICLCCWQFFCSSLCGNDSASIVCLVCLVLP